MTASLSPLRRPAPRPAGGWGAHGGLGRHQPGGTPSIADLHRALGLGLDYMEIDVLLTADGELILRHDRSIMVRRPRPEGPWWKGPRRKDRLVDVPVSKLTLAEVRAAVPHTLTLGEAVALVGHRTPLLVDIHTDQTAAPLGRWLALNALRADFSVCSKSLVTLKTLQQTVPSVPRLLTLPDMAGEMRHPVFDIARTFVTAGSPRELLGALGAVIKALADGHPRLRVGPFTGITWRPYLRDGLARLTNEVGASGLCVHQWLITRDLVTAAHDLGLPVTGWTVNTARDARRLLGLGVDRITSDDPARLRQEVQRPSLRSFLAGLRVEREELGA